jgi:Asp-tRNA(Asn)/Glu-tRNA(Gln) amidotransferase A subunit family amidase
VAAGIGPVALGTDGGGSTRLPAALNGIVGVYPSRGRVPAYSDLYRNPTSGAGPLTRDVRDAALLLQVIAGPSERDPISLAFSDRPNYLTGLDSGISGLRLAWSSDFGRIRPHEPAVVDAVHKTASLLGSLEEPNLHLPDPFDTMAPNRDYTLAAASALPIPPGVRSFPELLADLRADPDAWAKVSPPVQTNDPGFVGYALSIPPAVRNRPVDRPEDVLTRYDVLLSPTISRTAFVCEEGIDVPSWTEYTYIANMAGLPAASVPAGFVEGLPVGLQILGGRGAEATVLRVARAVEQLAPWEQHRPPIG